MPRLAHPGSLDANPELLQPSPRLQGGPTGPLAPPTRRHVIRHLDVNTGMAVNTRAHKTLLPE
jgi:hypothetical protein